MIAKYRVTYADEPDREWLACPLLNSDFIVSPPKGESFESVKRFHEDLKTALAGDGASKSFKTRRQLSSAS